MNLLTLIFFERPRQGTVAPAGGWHRTRQGMIALQVVGAFPSGDSTTGLPGGGFPGWERPAREWLALSQAGKGYWCSPVAVLPGGNSLALCSIGNDKLIKLGGQNGLVVNNISDKLIEQYELHIKKLDEEILYLKGLLERFAK